MPHGPTSNGQKEVRHNAPGTTLEGLKIELELSLSDTNFSVLSRDSRQPIISKPPAGGGVFKHVRCNDSNNGTCIQFEVSDVIWYTFMLIQENISIYDQLQIAGT